MVVALESMEIALRVLRAFRDRQPPDPRDVGMLREFAPASPDTPVDDVACDVIKLALERRAAIRAHAVGIR